MSFVLHASWDLSCLAHTVTLDESGVGTAAVTLSSGLVAHEPALFHASSPTTPAEFGDELKTALEAAGTDSYTVDYTDGSGYTISANNDFLLTFGTDAGGVALRQALGFTTAVLSYDTSHSSDADVWHRLEDDKVCRSVGSGGRDIYEPDGLVSGGYTRGGAVYSIGPKPGEDRIEFWDYELKYLDRDKTRRRFSSGGYTLQDFWETAPYYPFVHSEGGENTTHILRPSSAHFDPTLPFPGRDHTLYTAQLQTYYFGD